METSTILLKKSNNQMAILIEEKTHPDITRNIAKFDKIHNTSL